MGWRLGEGLHLKEGVSPTAPLKEGGADESPVGGEGGGGSGGFLGLSAHEYATLPRMCPSYMYALTARIGDGAGTRAGAKFLSCPHSFSLAVSDPSPPMSPPATRHPALLSCPPLVFFLRCTLLFAFCWLCVAHAHFHFHFVFSFPFPATRPWPLVFLLLLLLLSSH